MKHFHLSEKFAKYFVLKMKEYVLYFIVNHSIDFYENI